MQTILQRCKQEEQDNKMSKQAITFFDDIIKALAIEAETSKYANIAPEVLQEFYSVTTTQQPTAPQPQQQYSQPQPVQNLPQQPTPLPVQQATAQPYQESIQSNPTNIQPPQNNLQDLDNLQEEQTPIVKGMSAADITAISKMDLQTIQRSLKTCDRCPLHLSRKNPVTGAGNPHADLMFIGETPGKDEDEQGIPFVGEAGQLLTKMINAMQFTRSDVYITNIVKCRPPKNRNPEEPEAEACMEFLKQQIRIIAPKVIVTLGAVPLLYLMKQKGITRARGHWLDYQGIKVMPTFHPAYLLRNPSAKKDVWSDLQQVMQLFGKTSTPITKRT